MKKKRFEVHRLFYLSLRPPGCVQTALQIGASGSRNREFLTGVRTIKPQDCCLCREDVVHTKS